MLASSSAGRQHGQTVIVGQDTDYMRSLPSHIEHNELTRMLSEHLSDYTEVKNVKVVRDNKGGVCAFVQCEASFPYLLL